MDVAPRHTTALDIPLDHFMPGEVWIGRAAVAEDAQMHDKLQTGVGRGIDDRLTLMDHLHRIPGCQEETVDPGQGGRQGSRIIEIQTDGVFAFLAPCVDLRAIARGIDDRIRLPLQFRDYRLTRSSRRPEDENSWFFAC